MKKYHLITGMPRSGSTLLTAILNQNPRFHASPSDGLYDVMYAVFEQFNSMNIYSPLMDETKRKNIFFGMIESFYQDVDKDVCFNTNRGWVFFPHLIPFLNPNIKFICCVRELPLIVNSFERLYQKHPAHIINIFRKGANSHQDYASFEKRYRILYENYLGIGVQMIKEISMSCHKDNFMFLEHEDLCNNPRQKIKEVYQFINEPYFEHNFNDVGSSHKELDLFANCPTLHTTEEVVRSPITKLYAPKQILDQFDIGRYWENN